MASRAPKTYVGKSRAPRFHLLPNTMAMHHACARVWRGRDRNAENTPPLFDSESPPTMSSKRRRDPEENSLLGRRSSSILQPIDSDLDSVPPMQHSVSPTMSADSRRRSAEVELCRDSEDPEAPDLTPSIAKLFLEQVNLGKRRQTKVQIFFPEGFAQQCRNWCFIAGLQPEKRGIVCEPKEQDMMRRYLRQLVDQASSHTSIDTSGSRKNSAASSSSSSSRVRTASSFDGSLQRSLSLNFDFEYRSPPKQHSMSADYSTTKEFKKRRTDSIESSSCELPPRLHSYSASDSLLEERTPYETLSRRSTADSVSSMGNQFDELHLFSADKTAALGPIHSPVVRRNATMPSIGPTHSPTMLRSATMPPMSMLSAESERPIKRRLEVQESPATRKTTEDLDECSQGTEVDDDFPGPFESSFEDHHDHGNSFYRGRESFGTPYSGRPSNASDIDFAGAIHGLHSSSPMTPFGYRVGREIHSTARKPPRSSALAKTPAPTPQTQLLHSSAMTPQQVSNWGSQHEKFGDWGQTQTAPEQQILELASYLSTKVHICANTPLMPNLLPTVTQSQQMSPCTPPLGADGENNYRVKDRKQKDLAKLKRVSMGRNSVVPLRRSMRNSRASLGGIRRSSVGARSSRVSGRQPELEDDFISREVFSQLNIIGGVFSDSFDCDNLPIISVAPKSELRVTSISKSHSGPLTLEVHNPTTCRKVKKKIFTKKGKCFVTQVANAGLLISEHQFQPAHVVYFLEQDTYQFKFQGSGLLETLADFFLKCAPPQETAQIRSIPNDEFERLHASGTSIDMDEEDEDEESIQCAQDDDLQNEVDAVVSAPTDESCIESMIMDHTQVIPDLPLGCLATTLGFLNKFDVSQAIQASRAWANGGSFAVADITARQAVQEAPKQRKGSKRKVKSWTEERLLETKTWKDINREMPWGRFLSEGAYKQVFLVSDAEKAIEAVSVMDVQQIVESGNAAVVEQELRVSLLVSELVRRNRCPNFIETFGVFSSKYGAPDFWGTSDCPQPEGSQPPEEMQAKKKKASPDGQFQFIQMELCGHGDLEEYIKKVPHSVLEAKAIQQLGFQMIYSMYTAQEELHMRHYDIKLLNFLLKDMEHSGEDISVRYGVNDKTFLLKYPSCDPHRLWVKLADFGTATVDLNTLGQCVGMDQFTTLENTPIDQLTHGDSAVQGYASDTWALGLSLLHLFTGHMPYEELLADVKCPKKLEQDLHRLWCRSEDKYEPMDDMTYLVVRDVIQSDEEVDDTLAHTLYRYLVLLGIPEAFDSPLHSSAFDTPVWRAILSRLERSEHFRADSAKWNIFSGSNLIMRRARTVMKSVKALDLLTKMLDFDPNSRPTMSEALESEFFESMCESSIAELPEATYSFLSVPLLDRESL